MTTLIQLPKDTIKAVLKNNAHFPGRGAYKKMNEKGIPKLFSNNKVAAAEYYNTKFYMFFCANKKLVKSKHRNEINADQNVALSLFEMAEKRMRNTIKSETMHFKRKTAKFIKQTAKSIYFSRDAQKKNTCIYDISFANALGDLFRYTDIGASLAETAKLEKEFRNIDANNPGDHTF
ncbi:Uncharacterised protein [uncultured archaeon]|nr:Uncharacterised protein [uncultured archaeon]